MAAKALIVNKNSEAAEVYRKSLSVLARPYPDVNTPIRELVFREFLTDSTGSRSMTVDGSSTPVEFCIEATDKDVFIGRLLFTIADQAASLSQFGNISALTNGCSLFYESQGIGRVIINDELKSNYDFVRMCGGSPAFGSAADSFRAANVAGNSEGYLTVLDFSEAFGIEHGIWLKANTTDRLVLQVNDNLTMPDLFEVVAHGKQLVEVNGA